MKFKLFQHRDDVLFVLALLLPAVFAGARYVQSDREMTQIVQARTQAELAANRAQAPDQRRPDHVRLADAAQPHR
jgi:hypothetical protein